jgi:hypothetical protein
MRGGLTNNGKRLRRVGDCAGVESPLESLKSRKLSDACKLI